MKMENKITQPWMKGLIISLVLIALSIIFQLTGLSKIKSLQWLQSVLIIGALIWVCIGYGKEMSGNVTFGNVFAHGFKATAAMTVIFVIYTVIAFKFLFPEMADQALAEARIEMEKNNTLSENEIDKGIEMTRKFFLPFAIGGILIGFAFIGAIGSLLGAAFTKKNPKTPFEQ
jgi:NADH:ubiquinone oxidoreductase subunit 6 (subunit J)